MSNAKETKLCKYCKQEIPKNAKVCPACKRKQSGAAKWIAIAVAAVVVISVIAALGSGDSAKKTGTVNGEENNTNNSQSASQDSFNVGDIVETKDMRISFISAEEYVSDNQFIQPKEGNVFYRMEFEFENISSSDIILSSMLNWECYADSYAVEQPWPQDDQLDGTLSSGKKMKGAVYFEIPQNAHSIELNYKTDLWSGGKVVFIVK